MRTVVQPEARDDLWRLLDWLENQSPAAARRAALLISTGLRDLGVYPFIGTDIGNGCREWPIRFGSHGFVIRYRMMPDHVDITRIFHSAQDRGS